MKRSAKVAAMRKWLLAAVLATLCGPAFAQQPNPKYDSVTINPSTALAPIERLGSTITPYSGGNVGPIYTDGVNWGSQDVFSIGGNSGNAFVARTSQMQLPTGVTLSGGGHVVGSVGWGVLNGGTTPLLIGVEGKVDILSGTSPIVIPVNSNTNQILSTASVSLLDMYFAQIQNIQTPITEVNALELQLSNIGASATIGVLTGINAETPVGALGNVTLYAEVYQPDWSAYAAQFPTRYVLFNADPGAGLFTEGSITAFSIQAGAIDAIPQVLTIAPVATSALATSANAHLSYATPADLALPSGEIPSWSLTGNTRTWAAGGSTIAAQEEILILPNTLAIASGSMTVSQAATVSIRGATKKGSGVTLTQTEGLNVIGGATGQGGSGSAFGINVSAPTGAATNFALNATGDINTTTEYRVGGTALAASNLSNGVVGSGAVLLQTSPTINTGAEFNIGTIANATPNSIYELGSFNGTGGGAVDHLTAHEIDITGDNLDYTGSNYVSAMHIDRNFGGSNTIGSRSGFEVNMIMTATTGNTGNQASYVALPIFIGCSHPDNGSPGFTSGSGGCSAMNPIVELETGATNFYGIQNTEFDEGLASGTSVAHAYDVLFVKTGPVNGTYDDAAEAYVVGAGTVSPWNTIWQFGKTDGSSATGGSTTILACQANESSLVGCTAENGFDLATNWTWLSTSHVFTSPGFNVDGLGDVSANSLSTTSITSGETVTAVSISGGGRYASGVPLIYIPPPAQGAPATAVVATMGFGSVQATVSAGAGGYTVNDVLTAVVPGVTCATPVTVKVTNLSPFTVGTNSVVGSCPATAAMFGTLSFTGGTGSGATASLYWQVVTATVENGGGPYGSAPTPVFTQGYLGQTTTGTTTIAPQNLTIGYPSGAELIFSSSLVTLSGGMMKFETSSTGAGAQTFTNSPCSGLTTEKWIPVGITGQTGTWYVPACQ